MKLKPALLAYCVLAALAGVAGSVQVAKTAAALGAEQHAASEREKAAGYAAELLGNTIAKLMEEQRENRLTASPEEAIASSARLQELKDEADTANIAAQQAAAEAASLGAKHERSLLLLVPLAALVVLHVIGAFYFAPQRQ